MEALISRFYDALRKRGWTVSRQDASSSKLPACISGRYHRIPAEWVKFLDSFSVCVSPDETAWFLCIDDFIRQGDDIFRWNEFELMSLQAAIDDNDAEWQRSIVRFWDGHLPVCLSVAGGYAYYAVRMSDGAVVHGAEPEFEETSVIAPSFDRFIEMVCAGECIL